MEGQMEGGEGGEAGLETSAFSKGPQQACQGSGLDAGTVASRNMLGCYCGS